MIYTMLYTSQMKPSSHISTVENGCDFHFT